MNKFIITNIPDSDETKPVLYKIKIGKMYYVHKGKKLKESLDRFLDDIWRGMRGKSCPDYYSDFVDYCNKYPAAYSVGIELIMNDEPAKLLKKEAALYKSMKKDTQSLNRKDIDPYKPEWMIRDTFQKRCENCLKSGIIDGKKINFRFCPSCGRLNR